MRVRYIAAISVFIAAFIYDKALGQNIPKAGRIADMPSATDSFPVKLSLSEIVVKGRKSAVRYQIDRQIYEASAFANAMNGNAVEVVKNLPSISVDGQGSIQLRGTTSFLVMINGRATQGDPAFILSQLPASQIQRVEIISTPGSAFDADGRGGIIHIITKTAPEDGLMLQSNLMAGMPSVQDFGNTRYSNPRRRSGDVSVSWRKGVWELGAGLNGQLNDMSGYRVGEVMTKRENWQTYFPSEGERSFRRRNLGAKAILAWEPTLKTRIDASVYRGERFQSRVADLQYQNRQIDLTTGARRDFSYFNENTQDKNGVFNLASLGLSQKINEGTGLMLSAQYEGALLKGHTTNKNLAARGSSTDFQSTENPSHNPLHAYRLKADLTAKRNTSLWQSGYQFRHDDQRGVFDYRYRNLGASAFTLDPRFTGSLRVSNHIHAAYVQASGEAKAFQWQAGLRGEYTHRSLESSTYNGREELSLFNLFPTVIIRYPMQEGSTLKSSYSRRIKRSNNFELNPIPEREHSETLEQGDPRLLPELTGSWELGWEKRLTRASFSVTAYHQRIKNPIQRVNGIFNDTILSRVYTNAEKAGQTGIETSLDLRSERIWQMFMGMNIYRYQISGEILGKPGLISNGSWVMNLNTTQTFTFKKNWSAQFSLNWLTRRATVQGADGPFISPNLSLKKTSKDGRWTLMAQWLQMDAGLGISNQQRISTWGTDFRNTTLYIYEPDQIQLSASFKLLRKNRTVTLPQSEMAEKEF